MDGDERGPTERALISEIAATKAHRAMRRAWIICGSCFVFALGFSSTAAQGSGGVVATAAADLANVCAVGSLVWAIIVTRRYRTSLTQGFDGRKPAVDERDIWRYRYADVCARLEPHSIAVNGQRIVHEASVEPETLHSYGALHSEGVSRGWL